MLFLGGAALAIGRPQSGAINAVQQPDSGTKEQHKNRIATIQANRAASNNGGHKKPSVAELTENQVTTATTVFYVGHKNSVLGNDAGLRKTSSEKDKDPINHKAMDSLGSRCGFSWDDAAVKCGHECVGFCMQGTCYKDLPGCDHNYPSGQCFGVKQGVSDAWCVESSKSIDGPFAFVADFYEKCICEELTIGTNTPI
jgi:hypothetical protein